MDVDELELRLQEALQESEEQHHSLAEENATLQQRVRQVSKLCCATQAQGAALLPQPSPAGADPALAGAELVEDYVSWVGCFVLQQGMHAPALQAQVLCCGLSALPQRLGSAIGMAAQPSGRLRCHPAAAGVPGQQGSARSAGHVCQSCQHVCQVSMCARSAGVPGQHVCQVSRALCSGAPGVAPRGSWRKPAGLMLQRSIPHTSLRTGGQCTTMVP